MTLLDRLLRLRSPGHLARAILRRIPGGRYIGSTVYRNLAPIWQRLYDPRRLHRRRVARSLARFLASRARLVLPRPDMPEVSIIVVLFNQAGMTLECLRSIAATADGATEIIIVDNASTDNTPRLLDRLEGARILRNAENRHFLHAVNQGAAIARGRALLLLNNDATLRPGSLRAALRRLDEEADIGAVGGPIVLPNGRLQEAGSIVFSDGSCLGYGRGGDPEDGAFRFARDVDYCSGAFLLIRRSAFTALGGFDPAFAPAYYEETDFCMRLRAAGYRVVYEPGAAIDHFEFASATSAGSAILQQQRNHAIFRGRHDAVLRNAHHPSDTPALFARMRAGGPGRVLVIDDRVPYPDLGSGAPRASGILRILLEEGWFVTFYPLTFPHEDWAQVRETFPARMEVMLGAGLAGFAAFLDARRGYYDVVVVCRPHNMQTYLREGGHDFCPRLVYDAEAFFAGREIALLALAGTPLPEADSQALAEEECGLARAADIVIAVSSAEAATFREAGCRDVRVLGHAITPRPAMAGHAERRDILFVGRLDDDPSPNVDGLLWFVSAIMPLLDGLIGSDWRLVVAGRSGAERVGALAGPRVVLLGRVADLTPVYAACRVFIAPTRYAAGIPHKVHEAAAHGVPVVATSLLAGQLSWRDGEELLAADGPDAFAQACARLYRDAAAWRRLRESAIEAVLRDCDERRFIAIIRGILNQSDAAPRCATSRRLEIVLEPVGQGCAEPYRTG
jgi:GT2 family glycosyltransferase